MFKAEPISSLDTRMVRLTFAGHAAMTWKVHEDDHADFDRNPQRFADEFVAGEFRHLFRSTRLLTGGRRVPDCAHCGTEGATGVLGPFADHVERKPYHPAHATKEATYLDSLWEFDCYLREHPTRVVIVHSLCGAPVYVGEENDEEPTYSVFRMEILPEHMNQCAHYKSNKE